MSELFPARLPRSLAALTFVSWCIIFSAHAETERRPQRLSANMPPARDRMAVVEEAEKMLDFIPEVVAVVDESPIAGSQIKATIFPELISRLSSQAPVPDKEELKMLAMHVTSQLVDRELLFQAGRRAGFLPSLEEAREHVGKMEENLGKERFEEALRQQRISRAQYLDQAASSIALNEWLEEEIFSKIEVDEEEIMEFYRKNQHNITDPEKIEVSHILVATPPNAEREEIEEAEKEVRKLLRKVAEDKSKFADLAEQYSDCPSRRNGGRLPAFTHGQMVPEFEAAAFATPVGEVAGPVKTNFGFHLILTHDRQEAKLLSYDEVEHELKRLLVNQKVNEKIEQVLDRQRREASIQILFQP